MRVLITGATGFVGRAVVAAARERGLDPVPAVRRAGADLPPGAAVVGELGPETDWRRSVDGVAAVIHLAARVHVMRERAADPLAEFRRVNVAGSVTLARHAAAAGARRLVFASSIKVNGEATTGRPYTEADPPAPEDAYGRSKLEAELALVEIGRSEGLEVVIVRPTLVVGAGAGGNLARLMQLVSLGLPLPLGGVHNRRSLVSREALADLLLLCAAHPAAAREVFLAAEEPPLSTGQLVELLAEGMGRPARLWRVPSRVLAALRHFPGAGLALRRLAGSLEVDATKARDRLGWAPVIPLQERIRAMAADYHLRRRSVA